MSNLKMNYTAQVSSSDVPPQHRPLPSFPQERHTLNFHPPVLTMQLAVVQPTPPAVHSSQHITLFIIRHLHIASLCRGLDLIHHVFHSPRFVPQFTPKGERQSWQLPKHFPHLLHDVPVMVVHLVLPVAALWDVATSCRCSIEYQSTIEYQSIMLSDIRSGFKTSKYE